MFNKLQKGQDKDLNEATKARNDRCIPIAEELIVKIGNYKAIVGSDKHKEIAENYSLLTSEILQLLLEKEVIFDETNYIMKLVLEHYQTTQDFLVQSLNKSMERATEKVWGKETGKVTLLDIDKILK